MTDKKKLTHYRTLAKSNHLGVADLEDYIEEGRSLVFTIKEVRKEMGVSVAGRKGDHLIAYFVEDIKPLCLNKTNAKRIRNFIKDRSPFIEHWKNVAIEFYIDETEIKAKGKKTMSPNGFIKSMEAVREGTFTAKQIIDGYDLTQEQINKLKNLK